MFFTSLFNGISWHWGYLYNFLKFFLDLYSSFNDKNTQHSISLKPSQHIPSIGLRLIWIYGMYKGNLYLLRFVIKIKESFNYLK